MNLPNDNEIEKLSQKIKKIKKGNKKIKNQKNNNKKINVISDFFAIMIIVNVIGYNLDMFFNTWPIIFVIFNIIGFISIFYNIYKAIE